MKRDNTSQMNQDGVLLGSGVSAGRSANQLFDILDAGPFVRISFERVWPMNAPAVHSVLPAESTMSVSTAIRP